MNRNIYQLLFVKFPIVFPLLYGFFLYAFPSFEKHLIIITILILGETHFGATWPFFLNKFNYTFINKKKIELIFIPLVIIILCLVGFFLVKNFFLFIFFMANMYHVTRQSYGVCKLYTNNEVEFNFQANFIYFINILFFIVAFFRFYIPVIDSDHLIITNLFFIFLIIISSFYYLLKFKFSENYLTFLTGSLIFYPVCFVSNPIHVILMGVTMHYTQYLYFTKNVYVSRYKEKETETSKNNKRFLYSFILIVVIYSLIMTTFSLIGTIENTVYQNLILVPIIFQMLHFYIDSQLWKFSDKHNRDNTLIHIKRII